MSSISSVAGSSFSIQPPKNKRGEDPQEGFLRDLLSQQGVSESDQKGILSDIKEAVKSTLGSGSRPDPAKLQSTVNKILEQHGLKSADFSKLLPPVPGSGRIAGTSSGLGNSNSNTNRADQQTSIQQLLEVLSKQADRNRSRIRLNEGGNANSSQPTSLAANADAALEPNVKNVQAAYSSTDAVASTGTLSVTA